MYCNYFGIYNELMAACITFLPFIFMFQDNKEEAGRAFKVKYFLLKMTLMLYFNEFPLRLLNSIFLVEFEWC